jgi:hypothetical protein
MLETCEPVVLPSCVRNARENMSKLCFGRVEQCAFNEIALAGAENDEIMYHRVSIQLYWNIRATL